MDVRNKLESNKTFFEVLYFNDLKKKNSLRRELLYYFEMLTFLTNLTKCWFYD